MFKSIKQKLKISKYGFTLVELLVVIAIIALLLSILMPSLSKVRESAKRAVCKSNLHQWGIVWASYSSDNNGKLMATTRVYDLSGINGGQSGMRFPVMCFVYETPPVGSSFVAHTSGEWSAQTLSHYIPGTKITSDGSSYKDISFGNIWRCPSNGTMNGQNPNPPLGYFAVNYSLYSRSDLWDTIIMGNPAEITRGSMESKRVLMADTIYRYGNVGWFFNHSPDGPSGVGAKRCLPGTATPKLSGVNRLFGDGHVEWNDKLDITNMLRNRVQKPASFVGEGGRESSNGASFYY
jgi:prepilin-type N-terminal cleavage/methylation domain-containing protein/prepilin-type processing-associated H-X9-DG protein